LTLNAVWPSAASFRLDTDLPGGFSYRPYVLLDRNTSVGVASSIEPAMTRVVVRTSGKPPHPLRTLSGDDAAIVAAVTVTVGNVFWAEADENADGSRITSIWRAALPTGPARRIAADASDMTHVDSAYDLVVGDGRIHWAATSGPAGERAEIRSVPVDGGPVQVRRLDRPFGLTTWPWATSSVDNHLGTVTLLNLRTGERRPVPADDNEIMSCGVAWCRVFTSVDDQGVRYEVQRVEGGARSALGDPSRIPVNVDVGLLDRFEVLVSAVSLNANATTYRLWLQDLHTERTVILADGTTGSIRARGGYVWWSVGEQETASWHALDLSTLT
jgi:hypothetical protein